MVDQETFSRRLAVLDSYLARAQALGATTETEFVTTPSVHDLAERYLHLAAEAMIDLANHWIAEEGLRSPASNRDTFHVLEEAGEFPHELAERLRGWAGFRNVLVHEYAHIDHSISWRAIHNDLDDLVAFRDWAAGKL